MNKALVLILVVLLPLVSFSKNQINKDYYLDLMQCAFEAYTPERIEEYISRVEKEGITEHGFARLASNLGILIAHGRLTDRTDLFVRMMDISVKWIPVAQQRRIGHPGNDFSVKEVVCCIVEVEKAGILPKQKTDEWRNGLKDMRAKDIYANQPRPGGKTANNRTIFGSGSECARLLAGIGGDRAFADKYLTDQLRFFDENGMYMDPGKPAVYDLAGRLQSMACLNLGYDGPAKEKLEENLKKSAFHTLAFQSVTGEVPYGGRSNQFLHNETVLAAIFEYYAAWFKQMGDMNSASRFKAAAHRAAESVLYWLNQKPVSHIKNNFPIESKYGCEKYAYFDKYMITMASMAYLAYRFADDAIPESMQSEKASTFVTSPAFHRIMMNAGGYTVQFDTDAEAHYDSNGMGRFQKAGAPPVLALSCPCPSESDSTFCFDVFGGGPLAISPLWDKYEIVKAVPGKVVLTDGKSIWTSKLSRKGLSMTVSGPGDKIITLPALIFDGETHSEVSCDGKTLSIVFNGWQCCYKVNGKIIDTGKIYGNRNGHLKRFDAVSSARRLKIKARIQSHH